MDLPEIVEVLDVELRADPYGTAAAIFKEVLEFVLDDGVNGSMSDVELDTLESVARLLMEKDPTLEIEPRAG